MKPGEDAPMLSWSPRKHLANLGRAATATELSIPDVSFVIPVFNSSQSIARVVLEIHAELNRNCVETFELLLVNDGSSDDSEAVCLALCSRYPAITFVQLDRNFGEHSAVLAGLAHARGRHICVMDDDGQNDPADAIRMLSYLKEHHHDVVYVQYQQRHHSAFRVLGSALNDLMATLLLEKPRRLYLSSFKAMTRKVALQLCAHSKSKPYLDASILRVTRNIGQVVVGHRPRYQGHSGYTLAKLIDLWLSMVLGANTSRLQVAAACAAVGLSGAVLMAAAIFTNWVFFTPPLSEAFTQLAVAGALVVAIQFLAIGGLGLYLSKVLAQRQGAPPYVLRYVRYPEDRTAQSIQSPSRARLDAEMIAC